MIPQIQQIKNKINIKIDKILKNEPKTWTGKLPNKIYKQKMNSWKKYSLEFIRDMKSKTIITHCLCLMANIKNNDPTKNWPGYRSNVTFTNY